MITVRRVGSGDAMILRELALRSLADSPSAFGRTLEQERCNPISFYEDQATVHGSSDRTTSFLLLVDDHIAGIIGAFLDKEDPSAAYLCAMWVDPAHRRRGAGTLLVNSAVAWVRTRSARVVRAWVADGNGTGRAFWVSAGFRASSTRQSHPTEIGGWETLYVCEPEPSN